MQISIHKQQKLVGSAKILNIVKVSLIYLDNFKPLNGIKPFYKMRIF